MENRPDNVLPELHRLLLALQEVQEQIERGPRQLKVRQQAVAQKQADLEAQKQKLKSLRVSADQKSLQLKSNEAKLGDLRGKLNQAQTNREFDIIRSQIEADTVANSVLEDEILDALEQVDAGHLAGKKIEEELAQAKADQVAAMLDDAITADCVVIGCDSMIYIDGRLVGKPASADAARSQWQLMGGRSGQLYTGHCLLRLIGGTAIHRASESSATTVHFAKPAAADLEAYIGSGEPLAVAGGFTLDGLGGWFVDRIEGDASNVIGVSLPLTRALLERVGLSVSDLWANNPGG